MGLLSDEEIKNRLMKLPGWEKIESRAIERRLKFKNFAAALQFVNRVGDLAEQADHHPDIFINYSRVTLTLSTHSAGGFTEKDFALAEKIEQIPK